MAASTLVEGPAGSSYQLLRAHSTAAFTSNCDCHSQAGRRRSNSSAGSWSTHASTPSGLGTGSQIGELPLSCRVLPPSSPPPAPVPGPGPAPARPSPPSPPLHPAPSRSLTPRCLCVVDGRPGVAKIRPPAAWLNVFGSFFFSHGPPPFTLCPSLPLGPLPPLSSIVLISPFLLTARTRLASPRLTSHLTPAAAAAVAPSSSTPAVVQHGQQESRRVLPPEGRSDGQQGKRRSSNRAGEGSSLERQHRPPPSSLMGR